MAKKSSSSGSLCAAPFSADPNGKVSTQEEIIETGNKILEYVEDGSWVSIISAHTHEVELGANGEPIAKYIPPTVKGKEGTFLGKPSEEFKNKCLEIYENKGKENKGKEEFTKEYVLK